MKNEVEKMSEWLDCIKTDDYMQVRAALCQSQTSCFSCPIKSLCSSRTVDVCKELPLLQGWADKHMDYVSVLEDAKKKYPFVAKAPDPPCCPRQLEYDINHDCPKSMCDMSTKECVDCWNQKIFVKVR